MFWVSDAGRRIEQTFLLSPTHDHRRNPPPLTPRSDSAAPHLSGRAVDSDDEGGDLSAVLRLAARIYLYAVVSGSYPRSEPIARAVEEMIVRLKEIPASGADRPLVFALFVSACMARDETQMGFFRERFGVLANAKGMGNCDQVCATSL